MRIVAITRVMFFRALTAFKRVFSRVSKKPNVLSFMKSELGAVAPFAVLTLVGALIAISFAVDTTRMMNSAAQVKRATDAAAMAIGSIALASGNKSELSDLRRVAYGYVTSNLGMDSELIAQINESSVNVSRQQQDEFFNYSVSVSLVAKSDLLGANEADQLITSTVEVVSLATEVALALPSSFRETESELTVLREVSKTFANNLLGDGGNNNQNTWLSLVPYSSAVNVYDPEYPNRVNDWAAVGALNPSDLRALFDDGKASSLADPRYPDRIAKLLCMYRGLGAGERYFWEEPPRNKKFGLYYLIGSPLNVRPGEAFITFGNPQQTVLTDIGCPTAPLLPLTHDVDQIEARLDQMEPRNSVNFAIAMGWAGMALSPAMRGSGTAGWGDDELPLDFDNSKNVKVVVMLANTSGRSFDLDDRNFYPGESGGGGGNERAIARQRFDDLCQDFRNKGIRFFFVGVHSGGPGDYSNQLFSEIAEPGLQVCTGRQGGMYSVDASSFAEGHDEITEHLEDIINEIRSNYYVRLIN